MAFLVVKGLFRGFIREMASLAGIILGILIANSLQPQMTAYLRTHLPNLSFLPVISFAGIFICVLILCNMLGAVLRLLFRKALLGWLDRTLGVGLAVTKGIILTYLAIVLLTFFLPTQTPLIARSRLAPWIILSYQKMVQFVLPDLHEAWKERFTGKAKETGFGLQDKGNHESNRDRKE